MAENISGSGARVGSKKLAFCYATDIPTAPREEIKMAGVCKLDINETAEELKKLLTHQKTAGGFQKIQGLYLLKIGQVKTVKELAVTLGVNRITVQRWLRQYRSDGLSGLLKAKQGGGRKPAIPPEVQGSLEKQLEDPNHNFKTYGDIQKWLLEEYKLNVSYKAVYSTVRYNLKGKFKKN